jgi:hypothetical protein
MTVPGCLMAMWLGKPNAGGGAPTYATFDPANKGSNIALSGGNLTATNSGAWQSVRATKAVTGKAYWEMTVNTAGSPSWMAGIETSAGTLSSYVGSDVYGYAWYNSAVYTDNGLVTSGLGAVASGAVLMFAYDAPNLQWWLGKNGTWLLSGNPGNGTNPTTTGITSGTYFPAVSVESSGSGSLTANFGATSFAYTVPSGFNAGVY